MEAGAAGAAGAATADAGAATQGTEAEGNEGQQQQNGLPENLVETLSSLQAGQEELRQFLTSQQDATTTTETATEEPDELDLSFLDPADPAFDPAEVATRLGGLIEQTADKRAQALVDQRMAPLEKTVKDFTRTAEAERLVSEFPEFGDQEVATEVVKVSRQIAEAHMPNDPKAAAELADQPWFWRLTYMAARAAESANQEGTGVPDPAHLEGGAGAGPGSGSQVDPGDAIVAPSRGGRSVLPF